MSRSEIISIEDIWKLTNGGEQIFSRELGRLSYSRNLSAPWRKDSVPSLRLKNKSGIIYYTDYGGDQSSGSAVDFLMKLYGLTFPQAIDKVKHDFNIKKKPVSYSKVFNKSKIIEKPEILYEANFQPFTKAHHLYWNKYYLSEDFVTKEGDIYAVRAWAIDKQKQKPTKDEIVFCYVFRDETGKETGKLKFLRLGPDVPKEFKWRTNVSNKELWYMYKYPKGTSNLFIAKSNKDALVNMKQGVSSWATQSENDVILDLNMPRILEYCDSPILNFGGDPQGTQASINVSKKWGLRWLNTPKMYLKDKIQDNADYVAEFGEECFKQLLKRKKYI